MSGVPPARGPLFVVGCPKSGTTLVQSLFDGHPDVVGLPVELQLFRVADVPTALLAPQRGREVDPAGMARRLLERRGFRLLLRREPTTELPPLSPAAARRFEQLVLDTSDVVDAAQLFVHVHRAYLAATGEDPDLVDHRLIVEKTPLQEEHALRLRRWFPTGRFLHVVRNPYANLHALRLRAGQRKLLDLRIPCEALRLSHVFGAMNAEEIEAYRFVRYEDLVADPTGVMQELADFAGVPFHETMLIPSRRGRPWTGNSMTGIPLSGIDPRPVDWWRAHVSDLEVALVDQRMGWVLDRFGYERRAPRSRLSPYRRLSGEDPLSWLLNRCMLHEIRSGPYGPPRRRP